MEFVGGVAELSEVSEMHGAGGGFYRQALDKFDKLMGDDWLDAPQGESSLQRREGLEEKFGRLFDSRFILEPSEPAMPEAQGIKEPAMQEAQEGEGQASGKNGPELQAQEDAGAIEMDDNGEAYMKNGELLSDTQYTVNGSTYQTDARGRPVSCDSQLIHTGEGKRNLREQAEAGGEERQEQDDGGHLVARIFGGAEGAENLVPMRRTLNRGDYKKMENEMERALQEGKKVVLHLDLEYEGIPGGPRKYMPNTR